MKRATIFLGFASSVAALALAVLVYDFGSRSATTVEPRQAHQTAPVQPESTGKELNESTAVAPLESIAAPRDSATEEDSSDARFGDENTRPRPRLDEETMREMIRKRTTRDIHDSYTLLFDDLGLTPQEQEALQEFLIDDRIARMTTPYQRGREMDPDERANRIWTIIGYPKLEQFLASERNPSYWEAQRIGSMLERKGVPITEAQRDGLFDILVATRDQYLRPSDLDSIDKLEQHLNDIDERDRHVIELAPSVLSSRQVTHLHERYQHCSYERARSLELQRKRRADNPTEDLPLYYVACDL